MRTVPLKTLTTQAWNQTVALLFRPIRWKIWLKLLLIAWLSGYLSQGGSQGNFNIPSQPDRKKCESGSSCKSQPKGKTIKQKQVSKPYTYHDLQKDIRNAKEEAVRYSAFIVAAIAFLVAWMALFAWLSARFSFVFVDVLSSGHIAVIEPFKRNRDAARTYFIWLLMFGIGVLCVVILFFWAAGNSILSLYAATPNLGIENFFEDHLWEILSTVVNYIVAFVIFCILLGVIGVWSRDFVVPIMFQKRCNVLEGWRSYLCLVRASPWEATKYILWRWLIELCAAVVYCIAMIGVVAFLVVIGLIGCLIGAGVVALVPALKWVLTGIGIVLIVIAMTALVFGLMLSLVPYAVWFRFFSLRYLQSLNMGCHFFNDTPPLPPAALNKKPQV